MGGRFEINSVNVNLEKITDNLDLAMPTPEEFNRMIEGFGRSIAHQEEVATTEEEKRKEIVLKIWMDSKKLNSHSRIAILSALVSQLKDKSDLVALSSLNALMNNVATGSDDDTEEIDGIHKNVKKCISEIKAARETDENTKLTGKLSDAIGSL